MAIEGLELLKMVSFPLLLSLGKESKVKPEQFSPWALVGKPQ